MNILLYSIFAIVFIVEILQIIIYTTLALTDIGKQKKSHYWFIVAINVAATAFLTYLFLTNI